MRVQIADEDGLRTFIGVQDHDEITDQQLARGYRFAYVFGDEMWPGIARGDFLLQDWHDIRAFVLEAV